MIEGPKGERLTNLATWLKQSSDRLRLLRDAVKQELSEGQLPNAFPASADAVTVLALIDPLASAMVRLSKTAASQRGSKNRSTKPKRK